MCTTAEAVAPDCRYGHKGSLAYVGRDKAVMDVPQFGPIFGYSAGESNRISGSYLHRFYSGAVCSLLTKQHSHAVVRTHTGAVYDLRGWLPGSKSSGKRRGDVEGL